MLDFLNIIWQQNWIRQVNNKQIKHDSVSRTEIHIQLNKYKEIFRTTLRSKYRYVETKSNQNITKYIVSVY